MTSVNANGGTTAPATAYPDARSEAIAENRQIQQAHAQSIAAQKTHTAHAKAKTALHNYRTKVQKHQAAWVKKNANKFRSREDAQKAWQAAWAQEGGETLAATSSALNDYNEAVQEEMRLGAGEPGGIAGKEKEILKREKTGDWTDQILNGQVKSDGAIVAHETPAQRTAHQKLTATLEKRDRAAARLQAAQAGATPSMPGMNGAMRRELRDDAQNELKAAQAEYQTATAETQSALKHVISLDIATGTAASADANLAAVQKEPSGARRADMADAVKQQQAAKAQLAAVEGGNDTLTVVDPAAATGALQDVMVTHPELGQKGNQDLYTSAMVDAAAATKIPQIKANLETLNPDQGPQWFQDLAHKDPVSAAFVKTLGVDNAAPSGNVEEALAKNAPVAFAMLKYSGQSLPPVTSIPGLGTAPTEAQLADYGRKQLPAALEKMPDEKKQNLQLLMTASGDVRINYVQTQVTQLLGSQSAADGVKQRVNDPDFKTSTAGEKATKLIRDNMSASFSLDQQVGIWKSVEGPMGTYVNAQAQYIKDTYNSTDQKRWLGSGAGAPELASWLKGMSNDAPPGVANQLIDATTSRFSNNILRGVPSGLFSMDGKEQLSAALQQVVDHAPMRAGDVAKWALPGEGRLGYGAFVGDLVTPRDKGTGVILGKAIIDEAKNSGKMSTGSVESLQDSYNEGLKTCGQNVQADYAQAQNSYFNGRREEVVQGVFDDLMTKKISVNGQQESLFGQTHDMSKIKGVDRDNMIGDAMGLQADNPEAAPGTAKYTSDINKAQIGQVEKWIGELGGDNAVVTFSPALYYSAKTGVSPMTMIKVDNDANHDGKISDGETRVIDSSQAAAAAAGQNVAWKYDNFKDFEEHNQLDTDGTLFMSNSSDLLLHTKADGHADVNLKGIEANITTGWETVSRVGDIVIFGGAVILSGAAIVFSAGTASPLVAAAWGAGIAAAGWGVIRTAEMGADMYSHGQSFNPINTADGAWLGFIDPQAGGLYLGGIASVTGLSSMRGLGFIGKMGQAARGEMTLGDAMKAYRGLVGETPLLVSRTAQVSGGLMMGQQTYQLGKGIANGQIDMTDWSLNSSSWDVALLGGGLSSMMGGHRAAANHGDLVTGRRSAFEPRLGVSNENLAGGAALETQLSRMPPKQGATLLNLLRMGVKPSEAITAVKDLYQGRQFSRVADRLGLSEGQLHGMMGAAGSDRMSARILDSKTFTERYGADRNAQFLVKEGPDGKPHTEIVFRKGLSASEYSDVAKHDLQHLRQAGDPKLQSEVLKLSEKNLENWGKKPVSERLDLYETRLKLELDAEQHVAKDPSVSAAGRAEAQQHVEEIKGQLAEVASAREVLARDPGAERTGAISDGLRNELATPQRLSAELPKRVEAKLTELGATHALDKLPDGIGKYYEWKMVDGAPVAVPSAKMREVGLAEKLPAYELKQSSNGEWGLVKVRDGDPAVMEWVKGIADLTNFRDTKELPPYSLAGEAGTVASTTIPGKEPVFGTNTVLEREKLGVDTADIRKAALEDIQTNLGKMRDVKYGSQDAQFLTHAEAEALIKAHLAYGQLPPEMTIYVDRVTCNSCLGNSRVDKGLSLLTEAYGVRELKIYDSYGNGWLVRPNQATVRIR